MHAIGNDLYRRPVVCQQGSRYSRRPVIERGHGIEKMRHMTGSAINCSHGLFVGCRRVTDARQNTEPDKRCQETSLLIFFRRVIDNTHPATTGFRQLLHFSRIGWTNARLILRPLLRPANEWPFQAQAQNLGG